MTVKGGEPRTSELPGGLRARVATAARAAEDKKAEDVLVLEVGPVLVITDAFVLATGTSARHVRTIAEAVEEAVKAAGGSGPQRIEGLGDARWVLLDFGDFVVHVFDRETRSYYSLERLWGDAPRLEWGELSGQRA
ncbi:MAG: ribosome silencing factor [Acidimicrobiales bacterium]